MKRIMICLDFTEMDTNLLKYAAYFIDHLKATDVYLVHFVKDFELEPELHEQLKEYKTPVDEAIEEEMKKLADLHLPNISSKIHYDVFDGFSYKEINKWAKLKKIDLIVAGRKRSLKGSGLMPQKLVKISGSHMLLVTENAVPEVKNIFVPIDFSDFSAEVTKTALDIQEHLKAPITLVHSYDVPIGYYKTGKNYKEFAAIIKKHLSDKYRAFIKSLNRPVSNVKPALINHQDKDAAESVVSYVRRQKGQLLIMGSYGRTAISSFILGSVAEKIIMLNNSVPMLILKKKEKMSFFEAIKKI